MITIGHFVMNRKMEGILNIKGSKYKAFSGNGNAKNNTAYQCEYSTGPIPEGSYYVIDRIYSYRELLNRALGEFISGSRWFALYRIDGIIDDETILDTETCINEIRRRNFRLHPNGPGGISLGCITVYNFLDFVKLASDIRSGTSYEIRAADGIIKSWGILRVKKSVV